MQAMRPGNFSRVMRLRQTWCLRQWWHNNASTSSWHLSKPVHASPLLRDSTSKPIFPPSAPGHQQSLSTCSAGLMCHDLDQRGLLRISGSDTLDFLQGLITNDTRLLEQPKSAIYAFILNIQGRVLYDLLLYNISSDETPTVLIECDQDVLPELRKLVKMYKIRRKVDISVCDEYQSCAVIPVDASSRADGMQPSVTKEVLLSAPDPRLPYFGWRLVIPAGMDVTKAVEDSPSVLSSQTYAARRYAVGLGEGTKELPPGNCFPLESNGNFLNGVSFKKGCYIGQELTSRSHHIGVTRKRLMPITYDRESHTSHPDDKVQNAAGKNSGRIKGVSGQFGLALLRLPDVIGENKAPLKTVRNDGQETGSIETFIPDWWHTEHDPILRQVLGIPQP